MGQSRACFDTAFGRSPPASPTGFARWSPQPAQLSMKVAEASFSPCGRDRGAVHAMAPRAAIGHKHSTRPFRTPTYQS